MHCVGCRRGLAGGGSDDLPTLAFGEVGFDPGRPLPIDYPDHVRHLTPTH